MTAKPSKPRYVDPALREGSASLPAEPPFVFRDVTARVFPIKANAARLYSFCDRYLNTDIPREIAYFRPSLPYVYVMVLNYGKMAVDSVSAQNLGWVSQHEVTFTVPLTWWRAVNGRLVFQDFAFVSPFIFVDDPLSQTTGREVYGWPKVAAEVQADHSLWTDHPRLGVRLFSLGAKVFPKTYAGQREQPRTLLQIDRDPIPSWSGMPPDPDNPWSPLNSLPRAASAYFRLVGDAVDMVTGLRLRGYRRSRASILELLGSGGRNMARLLPQLIWPMPGRRDVSDAPDEDGTQLHIEQITLKQFRDVGNPNDACYQALVASSMGFDRLNRNGLLGDVNLLRGDPSGGFTLRIHRYGGQPIVESLGMQVLRVEEGEDAPVDILKPTLPFWSDVDLSYGAGRVICSRTPGMAASPAGLWRDEQPRMASNRSRQSGRPTPQPTATPPATQSPPGHAVEQTAAEAPGHPCRVPYNTARGAATQPISGPFRFPDLTLQVYPLLADRTRLEELITRYLNQPLGSAGHRFEPAGSYVYLMVNQFGDQLGSMWSEANNIGWWADKEVSFCVPVKWFHDDELVGLALVSPFVFASSGRAAITDREVNGRPTIRASIESPPDSWLSASGPVAERRLLRVETQVFPALHLGEQAEQRTLLEIDGFDSLRYDDAVGWRQIAQRWGETLVADLKRKCRIGTERAAEVRDAKALARSILAQEGPIHWITLKQYRDAAVTDNACYQALVHTTRSITGVYDLREIEERIHVRLHRYPGQPIADTLGLEIKHTESRSGNVVQHLQPIRPFWLRISAEEALGSVLCWRDEDGDWTAMPPWSDKAATHRQADAEIGLLGDGLLGVGAELGEPQHDWQRLKDETARWLQAALTEELAAILDQVSKLKDKDRAELKRQWAAAIDNASMDLLAADTATAIADALPSDALRQLVDAGTRLLIERLPSSATGSRRMTRARARESLKRLDEIQVVIEAILSEEWEHWGNPRRLRETLDPKPNLCIRADSVGNARQRIKELHPDLEEFEDAWWYLPDCRRLDQ